MVSPADTLLVPWPACENFENYYNCLYFFICFVMREGSSVHIVPSL